MRVRALVEMATTIEDISDSEGFQASTSGLQTVISNAMMQVSDGYVSLQPV